MTTYYRVDKYIDGCRHKGKQTFGSMERAGQFALGEFPTQTVVVKISESDVVVVNPQEPPEINVGGFTLFHPQDLSGETAEGGEK